MLTAFENIRLTLSVLRLTVRTVVLNGSVMQDAASDSFMGATDLADYLVLKGVPFRTAHDIVARAVRAALTEGKQLADVDLKSFSAAFADIPADYLLPSNIVARKDKSFTRPEGL
jgi:argininosuccinate lyase